MWAVGKWITDNVLKVLGSTGDTGGSATTGTAMAKANKAIGELTNGTYGLSALGNGGVKAVKSVQRGVHAGNEKDIVINISSVNPAKCQVTLHHQQTFRYPGTTSNATFNYSSYVKGLTATQLQLSPSYYQSGGNIYPAFSNGSWEIVEYY